MTWVQLIFVSAALLVLVLVACALVTSSRANRDAEARYWAERAARGRHD